MQKYQQAEFGLKLYAKDALQLILACNVVQSFNLLNSFLLTDLPVRASQMVQKQTATSY